jgi:hypothetical protein
MKRMLQDEKAKGSVIVENNLFWLLARLQFYADGAVYSSQLGPGGMQASNVKN